MTKNKYDSNIYPIEERYIISESNEINIGENEFISKLASLFPALTNKNYQYYFIGQLISLIGTWLQMVAQGWLILQLTHSGFWIGLIAALNALPSLFFSLFGGVIVDRFSKKKILIWTQIAALFLALILGVLTILKIVTSWQIAVLAFLLGIESSIEIPARQSFFAEIVDKEQLPSAIALNSGIFNAARVIGPSFAGLLIAAVGIGGAFLVNAISFIPAILTLYVITTKKSSIKQHLHPIEAIKEGLSYSFSHPVIKSIMQFTAIIAIFGWAYLTVMPLIAERTFHTGAAGLGYLFAAGGLGALTATIIVSGYSKKISALLFIVGGNSIFAISLFLFTLTTNYPIALLLLYFVGFGLLAQFSMLNATLQQMVPDHLRGRVLSIYTVIFLGLAPIGNFLVGWLSDQLNTAAALQLFAVIVFVSGIVFYLRKETISEAYAAYRTQKQEK